MIHQNKVVLANMLEYTLFDEMDVEDRLFVSWESFEQCVQVLVANIRSRLADGEKIDSIYALPKGGLCLGVKLAYMLQLPLITDQKKLTKNTLIVDDCTKTGKTLSKFKDHITAVMFHKPSSSFKPDMYFQETDKQINFCWESKEERN